VKEIGVDVMSRRNRLFLSIGSLLKTLTHITGRRWCAVLLALIAAQGAHAMGSTAEGSQELSFHDAPYRITMTIPQSRDKFELHPGYPARIRGGRAVASLWFTPPGVGSLPNQSIAIRIVDRGGGADDTLTYPINPTVPEFIAEYSAYQAHLWPRVDTLPEMRNVSKVLIGDRAWFQFTLLLNPENNTYKYLYGTPLDGKKMLVFDWNPPRGTDLFRSMERTKRLEIESMVASIRVTTEP
jgi:hypothetical protein